MTSTTILFWESAHHSWKKKSKQDWKCFSASRWRGRLTGLTKVACGDEVIFSKFYRILQNSTGFCKILQDFARFWNFWNILHEFSSSCKVLQNSVRLYIIWQPSAWFWKILQVYASLCKFMRVSASFWMCLLVSASFCEFIQISSKFCKSL